MIRVDGKIINLIEKITNFIDAGKITADSFPLESVAEMIENTLGVTFWECSQNTVIPAHRELAVLCIESLQDAVGRRDMEGCKRVLALYKNSYQTIYSLLNEDEKVFKNRPYLKMIHDLGDSYAQVQSRMHLDRMGKLDKKEEWTLAEGKGVVYTYLEEGDILYQPQDIRAQIEYICFTPLKEKDGLKEGVWKYCAVDNKAGLSARLLKSYYRIFAHEVLSEYDYSIWIEPNMVVVGDVCKFCKVYGNGNTFLGFARSGEDCIYEDISCTQMGTDDLNIYIRKKIMNYQKEGYPEHHGLIDNSVMARSHRDVKLQEVMQQWWKEVEVDTGMEASLFNYVAWKNEFPFSICDLFVYNNLYFVNKQIDLDMKEEY